MDKWIRIEAEDGEMMLLSMDSVDSVSCTMSPSVGDEIEKNPYYIYFILFNGEEAWISFKDSSQRDTAFNKLTCFLAESATFPSIKLMSVKGETYGR